MTDTDQLTQLQAENARLRQTIDKLESQVSNNHAYFAAAEERLKALATYIGLVEVAVRHSVVSKWKRKSLIQALTYLEGGAKDRIKPLWKEHPNDTFREAWGILQYWDFELDHDPQELKKFKAKFQEGSR